MHSHFKRSAQTSLFLAAIGALKNSAPCIPFYFAATKVISTPESRTSLEIAMHVRAGGSFLK